jgi:putrescine aminotransferase
MSRGSIKHWTAPLDNQCARAASGATIELGEEAALLDFESGGFGHGSREIVESVLAQIRRNPLSTRHFLSLPLARLSRRLASICPSGGDLQVSYLCNSGSEAVEGALKLACGFRRERRRFIALEGAYHGSTLGALSVCGLRDMRRPFLRLPLEASLVSDVSALPERIDEETAAVIVEPWPGGRGRPVPQAGWMRRVAERCRETGTLLVADETRTGLGRSGTMFAVDQEEVVPDVLVVGGSLGGGVLPVAGYVASRRVNDRVYARRDPTLHASATGGNPAACAAGLATIDLLERADLLSSVRERSALLEKGLTEIAARHASIVADIRGVGLSFWIDLRGPPLARKLACRAWEGGLALGSPTSSDDVSLRVFPPLLVAAEEISRGLEILEATLDKSEAAAA